MTKIYAQGDIILELVKDAEGPSVGSAEGKQFGIDPDGSGVLARGEVTGHRHRFHPMANVTLFRDDALAKDIPSELYIGHVKIASKAADLVHEEHSTIPLPPGTYRVRRQREWTSEQVRIVAD